MSSSVPWQPLGGLRRRVTWLLRPDAPAGQRRRAERARLDAAVQGRDRRRHRVVRGTDFYRPAHETIFDAMVDLYGRGEPVDPVTVGGRAAAPRRAGPRRRRAVPAHAVGGVPIAANAGYYAEIVREKAILRRLVDAGTRIAQMGYAGEGMVDDVVDRAQQEVYGVTDKRSSEDYAPLSAIMEATLDEIEAISNRDGEMAGVPTGFADLDELTNGLHPRPDDHRRGASRDRQIHAGLSTSAARRRSTTTSPA